MALRENVQKALAEGYKPDEIWGRLRNHDRVKQAISEGFTEQQVQDRLGLKLGATSPQPTIGQEVAVSPGQLPQSPVSIPQPAISQAQQVQPQQPQGILDKLVARSREITSAKKLSQPSAQFEGGLRPSSQTGIAFPVQADPSQLSIIPQTKTPKIDKNFYLSQGEVPPKDIFSRARQRLLEKGWSSEEVRNVRPVNLKDLKEFGVRTFLDLSPESAFLNVTGEAFSLPAKYLIEKPIASAFGAKNYEDLAKKMGFGALGGMAAGMVARLLSNTAFWAGFGAVIGESPAEYTVSNQDAANIKDAIAKGDYETVSQHLQSNPELVQKAFGVSGIKAVMDRIKMNDPDAYKQIFQDLLAQRVTGETPLGNVPPAPEPVGSVQPSPGQSAIVDILKQRMQGLQGMEQLAGLPGNELLDQLIKGTLPEEAQPASQAAANAVTSPVTPSVTPQPPVTPPQVPPATIAQAPQVILDKLVQGEAQKPPVTPQPPMPSLEEQFARMQEQMHQKEQPPKEQGTPPAKKIDFGSDAVSKLQAMMQGNKVMGRSIEKIDWEKFQSAEGQKPWEMNEKAYIDLVKQDPRKYAVKEINPFNGTKSPVGFPQKPPADAEIKARNLGNDVQIIQADKQYWIVPTHGSFVEGMRKWAPQAILDKLVQGQIKAKGEVSELTSKDREYLAWMKEEVNQGQPGYWGRWNVELDKFVEGTGGISTYPDWVQNQGLTKKGVIRVIEKMENGKPFTEGHVMQKRIRDLVRREVDHFQEEESVKEEAPKDVIRAEWAQTETPGEKIIASEGQPAIRARDLTEGQKINIDGEEFIVSKGDDGDLVYLEDGETIVLKPGQAIKAQYVEEGLVPAEEDLTPPQKTTPASLLNALTSTTPPVETQTKTTKESLSREDYYKSIIGRNRKPIEKQIITGNFEHHRDLVQKAWDIISTRYPKLANYIPGIEIIPMFPITTGTIFWEGAIFPDRTIKINGDWLDTIEEWKGISKTSPLEKVTGILGHEITHLAQKVKNIPQEILNTPSSPESEFGIGEKTAYKRGREINRAGRGYEKYLSQLMQQQQVQTPSGIPEASTTPVETQGKAITQEPGLPPQNAPQEGKETLAKEPIKIPSNFPIKISPDDISYKLAFDAYQGSSFVPDERANQEQREYVGHMINVYKKLSPLADTEEKKIVLCDELERYKQGIINKTNALLSAQSRTMSPMITGPARFPVERNQKRLDTVDKRRNELLDWMKKGQSAIEKKLTPSSAIKTEDPEAIKKLQEKVDKLEKFQVMMKDANKIVQKKGLTDDQKIEQLSKIEGISKETAKGLLKPDYRKNIGFADYQFRNSSAEIRRLKARIEEVSKKQSQETKEIVFDGGYIIDNVTSNRLQIFFDNKPVTETIDKLKKVGFHWSPNEGAWQRHRSEQANYQAEQITGAKINQSLPSEKDKDTPDTSGERGSISISKFTQRAWEIKKDIKFFIRPEFNPGAKRSDQWINDIRLHSYRADKDFKRNMEDNPDEEFRKEEFLDLVHGEEPSTSLQQEWQAKSDAWGDRALEAGLIPGKIPDYVHFGLANPKAQIAEAMALLDDKSREWMEGVNPVFNTKSGSFKKRTSADWEEFTGKIERRNKMLEDAGSDIVLKPQTDLAVLLHDWEREVGRAVLNQEFVNWLEKNVNPTTGKPMITVKPETYKDPDYKLLPKNIKVKWLGIDGRMIPFKYFVHKDVYPMLENFTEPDLWNKSKLAQGWIGINNAVKRMLFWNPVVMAEKMTTRLIATERGRPLLDIARLRFPWYKGAQMLLVDPVIQRAIGSGLTLYFPDEMKERVDAPIEDSEAKTLKSQIEQILGYPLKINDRMVSAILNASRVQFWGYLENKFIKDGFTPKEAARMASEKANRKTYSIPRHMMDKNWRSLGKMLFVSRNAIENLVRTGRSLGGGEQSIFTEKQMNAMSKEEWGTLLALIGFFGFLPALWNKKVTGNFINTEEGYRGKTAVYKDENGRVYYIPTLDYGQDLINILWGQQEKLTGKLAYVPRQIIEQTSKVDLITGKKIDKSLTGRVIHAVRSALPGKEGAFFVDTMPEFMDSVKRLGWKKTFLNFSTGQYLDLLLPAVGGKNVGHGWVGMAIVGEGMDEAQKEREKRLPGDKVEAAKQLAKQGKSVEEIIKALRRNPKKSPIVHFFNTLPPELKIKYYNKLKGDKTTWNNLSPQDRNDIAQKFVNAVNAKSARKENIWDGNN